MPDLATWGIAATFAGGLVSFFSPCTLPLVPGYLSVVTGGALAEASNRLKAFWLSLCFVMGFSLVFVALGASASVLGQWLMAYREEANLVAGVLIVLMGQFMLGWWSMPALQRDWRIGQSLEGGRPTAAFLSFFGNHHRRICHLTEIALTQNQNLINRVCSAFLQVRVKVVL